MRYVAWLLTVLLCRGACDGGGSMASMRSAPTGNSSACSYSASTTFATGSDPRSVVVVDLNGDGILDVVAADPDDASIGVLLGQGRGAFASAISYEVGSNPYEVIAGDFNGDGILDLATADFGGQEVSVLFGKGGGRFATFVAYTVGGKMHALIAAGAAPMGTQYRSGGTGTPRSPIDYARRHLAGTLRCTETVAQDHGDPA